MKTEAQTKTQAVPGPLWEHTVWMDGYEITIRIRATKRDPALPAGKQEPRQQQESEYLDSRFIQGVIQLMQERPVWEGEPAELFAEVSALMGGPLENEYLAAACKLLCRLQKWLYDGEGILVSRRKSNGRRYILLSKAEKS